MMGKTATINVRVDEDDKKSAEFVLNQLGMPMSTLVTLLLKQVSLTKSIPFNISLPLSPYTDSIENMTSEEFGKMMIQEYQNAEEDNIRPVDEFFNEFRMKIDG